MSNSEQQARDNLAEKRQHEHHRQEAMRARTESELQQDAPSSLDEQSRSALTQQRQQQEHLQDNLLERSEEEVQ